MLALATAPTDMARATALATDAQAALRKLVDERHADHTRLDEIDAWLAAHRR